MQKLTKIVATISDRNCDVEFLQQLYNEGMNVVRLNTAHQSFADTLKVVENTRKVSDKIALLLDTKGPEIRTTKATEEIPVTAGDLIKVKGDPNGLTSREMVYVSYEGFVQDVPVGSKVMIDDGELELVVVSKEEDYLLCQVNNGGVIEGKKSINIPSVHIHLPALSEKDRSYIDFAIEHELDFIAHSFVRNREDVLAIKEILQNKGSRAKIIAKIENQQGIDNIDEILEVADGVMVARGDLAIEVPRAQIPVIQKRIIRKCISHRKPVIIATQMLHSMIKNPRPTRAEVSDIATAIYDGTDAIMLSGETAYGKYPIEAVRTMTQIALEVEANKERFRNDEIRILTSEVSAYMSRAAVKAAASMKAKAIISDTTSGRTIRNLTGFRGDVPVYALCYRHRTVRQLALSYGVYPYFTETRNSTDEFLHHAMKLLIGENRLKEDDRVVVLAGSFGRDLGASFIEIGEAADIMLNRNKKGAEL